MKTMRRFVSLLSLLALVGSASSLFAQDANPLKSEMTAFRVGLDANGKETLTVAESVEPGETVQYVLTYANVSDAALSQIKVDGPVPDQMMFVGDSVQSPAGVLVEYSIDGGQSYAVPPIMFKQRQDDGTVVETVATPDMYTGVRWTLGSLGAGAEVKFSYRVRVR